MSDSAPTNCRPQRILICIVNYRAGEFAIGCLASLEAELAGFPDARVVVVDNASGDGSADAIEHAITDRGWGDRVSLVRAGENRGFAAGNNLALRPDLDSASPADYYWLLNPDTEVFPGALDALVDFLEANPQVGIAGSRLQDPDGTPHHCCFRFPSLVTQFTKYLRLGIADRLLGAFITRVPISDTPHPIDWVSGASMMVRREVLEAIGLLDEQFFLYFEETDFTHRALRAGWTCWHVPDSRAIHHVARSTGVTNRRKQEKRQPTYWFESRHRYFLKNRGRLYTIAADAAAMLGLTLWRLRRWIERKPDRDPPRYFGDFWRHSVFVRGVAIEAPESLPHEAPETPNPDRDRAEERFHHVGGGG